MRVILPPHEKPGRILCLLGMCVAFAGIGTGHLSKYFIYLDVFSHLTLHFAIAAITLGWAFLLPRYRLTTAISLMLAGMVALGAWGNYGPHSIPRGEVVPPGHRELRVMSFNIWLWNRDQVAIEAEIKRMDPDIVFMAEVVRPTRDMAGRMVARYPYQYPKDMGYGFLLWMMSRYPLQDVVVQSVWEGPVYLSASLGPEWGNLTILGTHTLRAPYVAAQWKQINALGKHVQTIKSPRLVFGDFNATLYSRMVRQLAGQSGLIRRTSLPTWPVSWPGLPQLAIDHMFADRELLFPDGVITGQYAGSDHLPIFARVLVPVPGQASAESDTVKDVAHVIAN